MSNFIKVGFLVLLAVSAAVAQPGPRPGGGGGSGGVTSFNTRTGAVVSVSADITSALGYTPLTPTVSTNAALKAALDATNNLGASAFTALSFQTNVATKAALDATNGLGSAAFSASSAFQSALGFTPLTPAVSTNAATKAALDATNSLGSAAFTSALGFTPLTPAVSTNAATKAAQDATNGLGTAAFTASSAYQTGPLTGDVTTSGSAATLKNTGTANTYRSVTFDAQGRETSGSNPTTFSGYGLSDTSANLAAAITDETGSGLLVFGTSPTIVTPTVASFVNATHNHQNAAGGGSLDAAAIGSGTVGTARLGSGSATSSTYLRGDQTWATVSTGLDPAALTNGDTRTLTFAGPVSVTNEIEAIGGVKGTGLTVTGAVAGVVQMLDSNNALRAQFGTNDYWSLSNAVTANVIQATNGQMTANQSIPVSTSTSGIFASNTTVATVGAQAHSPYLELDGNGWKTTATAGSQPIGARIGAIPIQGATSPSTFFRIQTMTNNAAFKTVADFSADAGQTNTGQFLAFGGGMLLSGPNGTSLGKVDSGANQLFLQAGTTVSMGFAGVSYLDLTTSSFTPAADNGLTYGDSTHRIAAIWLRNWVAKTADTTTTSATLATTSLATASLNGRCEFTCTLFMANSIAADGVSIAFDGGTATATTFRCHVNIYDTSGLLKSQQVSALATTVSTATITGDSLLECHGYLDVNSGGTLIPRFAVNNHTTGTLTCYKGSSIIVHSVP